MKQVNGDKVVSFWLEVYLILELLKTVESVHV